MMSFLERPLTVLKMGLRQHEAILAPVGKAVLPMMKKYDWTCHRCGIKIPQYMQVDHTKGHGNPDPDALRPICVFCHDQDHIIWAAARKRVLPVVAPDMTNEQISRISWAVVSLRSRPDDQEVVEAIENIIAAFRKRHHDFIDRYGSEDADSAIEAVFRFLLPQENESEREAIMKKAIVERFSSQVRFVPRALIEESVEDVSTTISVWSVGGFREPARAPTEAVILRAEPADLMSAVSALISER